EARELARRGRIGGCRTDNGGWSRWIGNVSLAGIPVFILSFVVRRLSSVSERHMSGNFFEDFSLGQVIRHPTPRTVSTGDVALYTALFGSRFAVQSSTAFA